MIERKTQRSPISKRKFYEINRDIKVARTTKTKTGDIAKKHGVSDETVRTIRTAGSWPKFEALKQARKARRVEKGAKASDLYFVHDSYPVGASGLDVLKAPVDPNLLKSSLTAAQVTRGLRRAMEPVTHKTLDLDELDKLAYETAPVSLTRKEYNELMALIPKVETLWKRVFEEQRAPAITGQLSEEDYEKWKPDDEPSLVNAHYVAFNEPPVEQPKKKRLGFFRSRR